MVDANVRARAARRVWGRLGELRQRVLTGMQGGLPALAALELTVPQSMVLFRLAERGPLTISELTAVSGRAQGTTSRLVAQLESRGLVARKSDPADARRTRVQATPKTLRLVAQVEGLRVRSFEQALASVPPALVRRLDDALAAVLDAIPDPKEER